jgi:hypothetical protein
VTLVTLDLLLEEVSVGLIVSVPDTLEVADPSLDCSLTLSEEPWLRASEVSTDLSVSVPDALEVADPSLDWVSEEPWLRASDVSADLSVSVPKAGVEYWKLDARLATRINRQGNIITFFMGLFTSFYN